MGRGRRARIAVTWLEMYCILRICLWYCFLSCGRPALRTVGRGVYRRLFWQGLKVAQHYKGRVALWDSLEGRYGGQA